MIFQANITPSRKNIKVSPCLATGLIWPLWLTSRLLDVPTITVLRDGHLVSRAADFIMYSVEAEFIDNVVAQYGPCEFLSSGIEHSLTHPRILAATKLGAIVSGQTSVKAIEKATFEKWLPSDVSIISCHSLHGPTVSPVGQPLVCSSPSRWLLSPPLTRAHQF